MSAAAMDAHFAETGAKLIADAGPLAGKTLQYFHIDSWELGQPTWTPKLREEFRKRRGYDPLLYLPALLQRTVDDPQTTRRFLADYRRTVGELVAENYYGRFRELTRQGRPARHAPGVRRAGLLLLDRRPAVRRHQRHPHGRVLEAERRARRGPSPGRRRPMSP